MPFLPVSSLDNPVTAVLAGSDATKEIVSSQLNSVLKAQLISAANAVGNPILASVLQSLNAVDLNADQNQSLRDFATRNTTLPSDPAAAKAAQAALATLSSTTTLGALLQLNQKVSENPALAGLVAQTKLGALLGTSPALSDVKLQSDFISRYIGFQGTTQDFWTQLSKDEEFKALIPELQLTSQLATLTLINPALISVLRAVYKLTSLRQISKLDATELRQLIDSHKVPVPIQIPGSNSQDQLTAYVNGMVGLLQTAFPTDYIQREFATAKDPMLQLVAEVLTNARDIVIQSTNLDLYLKENSAKAFQNIPPAQIPAVTKALKSAQRVSRISTDPNTVNQLMAAGLDSAAKIASIPKSAFVSRFSAVLGGDSEAQTVHTTAVQINAQALNLHRIVQSGLLEINPRAIGNPKFDLAAKLQTQIPTWQDLFGSTSYCECEECSSVYGPAAYFVDLLQFLRYSTRNSSNFTPLDVLIGGTANSGTPNSKTIPGRRPDLAFIKLNCENANTPLPYIDLINEVLESYVVNGNLGQATAHDTPADATAAELSVNPEYTLDGPSGAYEHLAQASYPLSLPYDRFLDASRTYLAFLGGDRRRLIELFETQQSLADIPAILAAEILQVSGAEFTLIANGESVSGTALAALYAGNATVTSPWEKWIACVPIFLKQTGITFADLISLLETQFINPNQTVTLTASASCDLQQTTISSLDDQTLARILPFLRLWRKLGWQMSELDLAMCVLSPSGINRGFLLALADVIYLRNELNLSVSQILSFWSNIDVTGRSSLYLRLFQNKAVLNPLDPALSLAYRTTLAAMPNAQLPISVASQISYDNSSHELVFTGTMSSNQRDDLLEQWATGNADAVLAIENLYEMRWNKDTDIAPGSALTNSTPAILAALRISSNDLNAIRTEAGLLDGTANIPLNLANVSQLYRYAVLAQALGLPAGDLIGLTKLSGIRPFQPAAGDPITAPLLAFVGLARTVQASAFSVAELNYIFRAIPNPASGVGPLDTDVASLALSTQTGLIKIKAANGLAPDPTGKLLRQKLGAVVAGPELSALVGTIGGTANTTYTAALPAMPSGVVIPADLSALLTYDPSGLHFSGFMSDGQKSELLALPSDPSFQQAVLNLYQQPRQVIDSALLSAKIEQTPNQPDSLQVTSDPYSYALTKLLPFVMASQSRALVQQSVGQALGIDSATVALLISGMPPLAPSSILKSERDKTQPAILDLLDLRDGGLLATSFSDVTLTTATGSTIQGQVSAAGITNPGGMRWQGKLAPDITDTYTFYITANDRVRLWVDDQLIIEQWSHQAVSTYTSSAVALQSGQLYDIRIDYFNESSPASAQIQFGWSSKSSPAQVPIPQNALLPANAFTTLTRLYPIGLLLSRLRLHADEVAYLTSHPGDFTGIDPSNPANIAPFDLSSLPSDRSNSAAVDAKAPAFFDLWRRVRDLIALRDSLLPGNTGLFDIFRVASTSSNPAALSPTTVNTVLAATGWDPNDFSALTGKTMSGSAVIGFGLSDADFVNAGGQKGRGLVRLKECLDFGSRLCIPAAQLFSWANTPPSSSQANDIKNTVKSKYDDATWVTVGKPLNDKIRENSKAALIAYVLNMPTVLQAGIVDANGLYEYFLIDVQMSSCMLTSRLVQATAAVQFFVQRCLLNLENGNSDHDLNIGPSAIDAAQWEWRKNYRVWEANREVFLYPENWIDPTLRDDRTPFFQDLQNELQQGELTADRAETAFQNYLTKLLEVSRLEICGLFYQNDENSSIYHVFGRTYAEPHVYYYRCRDNDTKVWSPWGQVDVDIEGDHLIPVVWNQRLHLFWPIFKEKSIPIPAAHQGSDPPPPRKTLEIRLAWSEYRNGAWTKKQVTSDYLTPASLSYVGDFDPGPISFDAQVSGPMLTINVFSWNTDLAVAKMLGIEDGGDGGVTGVPYFLFNLGSFVFNGCSAIPAVSLNGNQAAFHIPANTKFSYMNLDETSAGINALAVPNLVPDGTRVEPGGQVEQLYDQIPIFLLSATPTAFSLLYADQYLPEVEINRDPPFFYADSTRTYFVTQQRFGLGAVLSLPSAAILPYSPEELNPAITQAMVAPLPIFAVPNAVLSSTGPIPMASPRMLNSGGNFPSLSVWEMFGVRSRVAFTFGTHHHAHVCDFLQSLNSRGIPGLLTLENQELDSTDTGTASVFYASYAPSALVNPLYPSECVDFSLAGAYSVYNWELFFHIPFLIATQLSQNQQFEDAEKWFRYMLNPASPSDTEPNRFWNVLPFQHDTEPERIVDLVTALQYTGTDPHLLAEKQSFSDQIAAWIDNPFNPDLIARMRIVAYQKAVIMKYIDHQLAWGDSLYRQFTRESVNEATLHYVLCQDLLGDKPTLIPPQGVIEEQTYHSLATISPGLDPFSDVLVELENLFPFSTGSNSPDSVGSGTVTGVAMVPYFCVPPNDTLLSYWETVAKRLFQIRHCQNIAGQVQELPLFAPPINPGLLVRGVQMGMDLSSALADISASTPFYRFAYMLPKVLELCAEVRALGASLLSALEKSDAESLSLLRTTQETALLKAVRNVKQQQLAEANSNLDALNDSLAVTRARLQYYQSLLTAGLTSYEKTQLSLLNTAQLFQGLSQQAQIFGSSISATPDSSVGAVGWDPSVSVEFGGRQLAAIANFVAGGLGMMAAMSSGAANISGIQGGWNRRSQEWNFQFQTASHEIEQINDQIAAASARVAAAQADLDNQDLQISQSRDIEQFLRTKFTNQALYTWMTGQVSAIYFQCYQMAYDLAKRAEACFVFERMPDLSTYTPFIQFGYWDSLKKGLLSGERLYQDLKRLEIAYMDQNQREYEITKSISLLLLDPMALINLKETGQCTVQFPEAFFDVDYPGHYLRRIKMLSLTIPCVVGPYTSLNCTLTLASSKIRFENSAASIQDYSSDAHFVTNFSAAESIATSSGQNDSGLFTVNFNDERYLPFEGAGVLSTWQLSMPKDTNAFDFETITDVIFNLKYTARDGGANLRSIARAAAVLPPGSSPGATVQAQTALPAQTTLTRMFSLRHEFPSEWYAFLHPPDSAPDQTMTINLTQERFPFQYRGKKIQIYEMDVFLKFRDIYDPTKYTTNGTPLGDYGTDTQHALTLNITPPGATAAKTLQLVSNPAVLAGVPYGSVPQPPPTLPPVPPAIGGLGVWTVIAIGGDIANPKPGEIANLPASLRTQVTSGPNTNNRLAGDAIEDVLVVCRLVVTAAPTS